MIALPYYPSTRDRRVDAALGRIHAANLASEGDLLTTDRWWVSDEIPGDGPIVVYVDADGSATLGKEGALGWSFDPDSRKWLDPDGYDLNGYDADGYDRDGFDEDDRDREGYDREGYDEDDRDREGYDRDGYDEDGYDRRRLSRCDNDDCDCSCRECHAGDSCECCDRGICECYCHECHAGDSCDCDENARDIPGYHASPRNWHNIPSGITIGVELETSVPDRLAAWKSRPEGMIGERDGSLDADTGIEWIGPPMAPEDYGPNGLWARWLKALRTDHEAQAWSKGDGYGMHVNIGRAGVPDVTQAKMAYFVNRFSEFSAHYAGRTESRWASYKLKSPGLIALNEHAGDKYQAVNVKRGVLEIRIFRASLNVECFHKNVEWCVALIHYVATVEFSEMTPAGFVAYFSARPDQYPNLNAWAARRGKGVV